ncbi:MAG: hypothetical protein P8Y53_10800 [Pseudolabrys sp.]
MNETGSESGLIQFGKKYIGAKEVAVTKVSSLRGAAHRMRCDQCGESLIAPDYTEYFCEEGIILNLWSCPNCGNKFETEAFIPGERAPEVDRPSRLVA